MNLRSRLIKLFDPPRRLVPYRRLELQDMIQSEIKKYGIDCDLNHIDVSNITDMSHIFRRSDFCGNISHWNTSKVERMCGMFHDAAFNGNISKWNVSNVKDMSYMFHESKFNSDISKWDTSKVTDMSYMFRTSKFNRDISNWNTSSVTNMDAMFYESVFNKNISQWDVSKVIDMDYMFSKSKFNGDISSWNLSSLQQYIDIFDYEHSSPLGILSIIGAENEFPDTVFVKNVLELKTRFSIFNIPELELCKLIYNNIILEPQKVDLPYNDFSIC